MGSLSAPEAPAGTAFREARRAQVELETLAEAGPKMP